VIARRLRLWTGLVLFAFVATHLLNHALGLISVEAAEAGRLVFLALWRNPLGSLLFYSSLVVHVGLVLWAIYERRHLRLPRWEVVRLGLGLAMPFLLLPHIFGTRVLADVFGVEDSYAYVVTGMWVLHPSSAVLQSVLLVIAWAHGWMGLNFWLSLKPWYPRVGPLLQALAVLLPVLALLGFANLGRDFAALAADPAWLDQVFGGVSHQDEETVLGWGSLATALFVAWVALIFVGRWLRGRWERRSGVIRLTYPGGRRVAVTPGTTVLEASRVAGVPHASLCGGRGRCSTCRSRLAGPLDDLPNPSPEEARVLHRVGAPPNVRLACQLRPTADLEVFPLLPARAVPSDGFLRPGYSQGLEQEIAILFADMRSFTQFSEHRLPYDVVFVLNQYFAAMGEAVGRSGGHLDKFIGDGVMALFGLNQGPAQGCRDALACAVGMGQALEGLNQTLANELREPLRIGIGIHTGPVIVGEMGYGRANTLTAIGDPVNTASRLETASKEYASQLVVSQEVAERAGLDLSAFPSHQIAIRGRTTALTIYAIAEATQLEPVLAGGAQAAAQTRER
jgi:adenylate cyclase